MGDIGKRIRELREAKGMTQEELAKKCGYKSRVSINKIELERDAPIKKLVPIALALGISPQELMGWTSDDEEVNEIGTVILLHDENKKLIDAYNKADAITKEMVRRILGI